ncbi:MAG: hypothetical protein GY947_02205 [Rhodobacteraceae bacterium]|nr:hypothetical protein [Paracoccaceae bacterium]
MRDADGGILAITSRAGKDRRHHANRVGRLQKLKSMGLAEELKPGVEPSNATNIFFITVIPKVFA